MRNCLEKFNKMVKKITELEKRISELEDFRKGFSPKFPRPFSDDDWNKFLFHDPCKEP